MRERAAIGAKDEKGAAVGMPLEASVSWAALADKLVVVQCMDAGPQQPSLASSLAAAMLLDAAD